MHCYSLRTGVFVAPLLKRAGGWKLQVVSADLGFGLVNACGRMVGLDSRFCEGEFCPTPLDTPADRLLYMASPRSAPHGVGGFVDFRAMGGHNRALNGSGLFVSDVHGSGFIISVL